MRDRAASLAIVLVVAACSTARVASSTAASPQDVADELIAADRAFAASGARTDVVSALSAMFAPDVIMPVPGNRFAEGRAAALDALRANADNARSRIEWAPLRAGVSADGQHGFTFGFMTLHRPDNSTVPLKYLAYWIRRPDGWRVVAYKRRPAPAGETVRTLLPPALPARIATVTTDAAALARHRASLDSVERAFSRDAQSIGLGAAFARYGSADAMNMGGPNDAGFVMGADAIGRAIGAGAPANASPVSWAPDRVIVASSGDLGITFGMIVANAGGQPPSPFFTIWRRSGPGAPWRYVAE